MKFWRDDIDPAREPHRILIKRDALADPRRDNRIVPFKIYYPVAHSLRHLPVIVWSHGLGGTCDGAAFIGRYLASHGYVVVNIQHHGTDSSLWEGKPGHPWDVIRATPIPRQTTIDRFHDVPFILDALTGWAREHPAIADHMDLSRLGMSGHSFGALTAQVMAGQGFPGEDGRLIHLREPRFRCGILYSPVPVHYLTPLPDADIYGTINLPLFHMTGTEDHSPVEGFGFDERRRVFDHAGAGAQHLLTLTGGDHMVFAGSRGKLAASPKRDLHETIIKIAALAFWDAHLRDDGAARAWLTGGALDAWLGAEASFVSRGSKG